MELHSSICVVFETRSSLPTTHPRDSYLSPGHAATSLNRNPLTQMKRIVFLNLDHSGSVSFVPSLKPF